MSKTIKIPGRLESAETGNVVAGANAILDDTKGKKQNVINEETDAELLRLDQEKQGNLTFDQTPTEDSTNPVTSGGVYAADQMLSQAIEAILLLIPSAASELNKLVDLATMNSSISTATASFKGTYNLISDLHLTVSATHAQIAAALDALSLGADNNDYAYVQVPNTDTAPTDIAKTERYKFNGENWAYEYDLNNSGFTTAQWNAINSGITTLLVAKLSALPTNEALTLALAGKQDNLTFDNAPTAGSNNPVKSGGIYTRNNEIVELINSLDAAKQNILTFDTTPTNGSTNPVTSNGVYLAIQLVQTAVVALDGRMGTAETKISTAEGNIVNLQAAYAALTQSDIVVVSGALPSSGQQQNIIYRQPDQDHTPPQFYSDYMWNGTAFVLMATYNNAIDPRPKKASQNLVTSSGVFDNMGALDVSELNATENPHTLKPYATLDAALADIPSDYQKGGMSIKYVQTSDNKYVQYRCMAQNFTTDVTQWQGIDDEPIAGSDNLVKSGGVEYTEEYNYEKLHSYNHNDPANEKDGYYFDANGYEVALADRKISGYIPCQGLGYLWQVNALAAGFYNIKKQWIASSYVNSFDNGKFAVSSGAYYVRIHGFANKDFGVYYKAETAVYEYGIPEIDVEQNDRIDNAEDDIDSIQALDLEWLESYNQANPADEKDGYYFDPNGYETAMAGRKISGYVKCSGLSKLWQVGGLVAGFYNANKVWISGSYVNSFDNNGFSVPAGAAYVRIHGFSTSSFGIYYEECHEYIPYGDSNLTKTIGDIERKIETSGGGGSASVTGYDIESVAGMAINVGAGKINGVESDAVQLTVSSPLSANKSITMTIPTSETVIADGNGYPCPCEVLSVVKDGVTLVEGTDYTWNVRAAVLAWRKTTGIKSLTGSAITGATVNIRFDYSRIDRIVVNKNTGVISLVKGYEGSTTTYDNSTLALVTPVGSDEKVLYNVFVRWGATSVLSSDIRPMFDYNEFGYKDEEYALIDSVRKEKASEIYPFYAQIAIRNLRVNTGNMPLNAQARTVRIGFIGDSRTDSEQPENIHDGIYYGYPFTFGRTIAGILNLGTRTYMQSHITCQRVLRDTQGSNADIEVINYGKGGNMIQEWMHSYYGYFDRPTAANDGLISLKSYNGADNIHDLVFINVTNPVFSCLELIDSQCPAALYKNDYTDSSYSLLYDIATRSKSNGGHYALELHSQSDYGDGTTEAQRKILLEDMNKVYKAMYQRLINTLKEQNPNVQIVILFGLPDQIGVYADNPVHYETSPETNRLMFDIAKSNNLLFMNLSYLFFGCEKRLGIYPLLTEYPEGNIHPSPYLHYVIGNVLTEYISNEMI